MSEAGFYLHCCLAIYIAAALSYPILFLPIIGLVVIGLVWWSFT